MAHPRVLILRAPGTNCDEETAFAFERAGAIVDRLHINALSESPRRLHRFQILVIPGGFSYGDDVSAGKILALRLQHFFGEELLEFRDSEKLILGICNGFQVLLKAGLLLQPDDEGALATLTHNDSGLFVDRWVVLDVFPGNCPFLKGLTRLEVPIAHGEGKFVTRQDWIAKGLVQSGQAVLRYVENPNGSQENIAGICDVTGRVFGLMPHPERHILPTQHPRWTRQESLPEEGEGLVLFRNAVNYFA